MNAIGIQIKALYSQYFRSSMNSSFLSMEKISRMIFDNA